VLMPCVFHSPFASRTVVGVGSSQRLRQHAWGGCARWWEVEQARLRLSSVLFRSVGVLVLSLLVLVLVLFVFLVLSGFYKHKAAPSGHPTHILHIRHQTPDVNHLTSHFHLVFFLSRPLVLSLFSRLFSPFLVLVTLVLFVMYEKGRVVCLHRLVSVACYCPARVGSSQTRARGNKQTRLCFSSAVLRRLVYSRCCFPRASGLFVFVMLLLYFAVFLVVLHKQHPWHTLYTSGIRHQAYAIGHLTSDVHLFASFLVVSSSSCFLVLVLCEHT
jgi:hypothetical protein